MVVGLVLLLVFIFIDVNNDESPPNPRIEADAALPFRVRSGHSCSRAADPGRWV